MPQDFYMALCFLAALGTLCALANSSVGATGEEHARCSALQTRPVRTDLTPRNKNECLDVARTLKSRRRNCPADQTGYPARVNRVASDLNPHAARRISTRHGSASSG